MRLLPWMQHSIDESIASRTFLGASEDTISACTIQVMCCHNITAAVLAFQLAGRGVCRRWVAGLPPTRRQCSGCRTNGAMLRRP